jgi:hypothetical protein
MKRTTENYRKLRKFLAGNAEKATNKYVDIIESEIIELRRTQHYDLMYTKTKELVYKIKTELKTSLWKIIISL